MKAPTPAYAWFCAQRFRRTSPAMHSPRKNCPVTDLTVRIRAAVMLRQTGVWVPSRVIRRHGTTKQTSRIMRNAFCYRGGWGIAILGRRMIHWKYNGVGIGMTALAYWRWKWSLTKYRVSHETPDVWVLGFPAGGSLVVPNSVMSERWMHFEVRSAGVQWWKYWERWDILRTLPDLPVDLIGPYRNPCPPPIGVSRVRRIPAEAIQPGRLAPLDLAVLDKFRPNPR